MSKKNRDSMEELWSKRFDEEADLTEDEPMSRKAKREREQGISPILTVTVIFLALLIILPISAYAWFLNREDLSESPTSPSVEQVALVEDEEADEDLEEDDEDEEDENIEEVEEDLEEDEEIEDTEPKTEETQLVSEPEESTDSTPAQTASSQESTVQDEPAVDEQLTEPELEPEPEQNVSQPETSQEAEYYIVSAGDNMYRIALNHGMSTEELMQLNGLNSETVYVGQELRVK